MEHDFCIILIFVGKIYSNPDNRNISAALARVSAMWTRCVPEFMNQTSLGCVIFHKLWGPSAAMSGGDMWLSLRSYTHLESMPSVETKCGSQKPEDVSQVWVKRDRYVGRVPTKTHKHAQQQHTRFLLKKTPPSTMRNMNEGIYFKPPLNFKDCSFII